MGKLAKTPAQPPAPPPNMDAINNILAKARSLVGSVKRTPEQQLEETPAATKARTVAAPPPPPTAVATPAKASLASVPGKRVHGKTTPVVAQPKPVVEPVVAQPKPVVEPKAPPPPPKHASPQVISTPSPKPVSPAGSFDSSLTSPSLRTKEYLENAKKQRLASAEQAALTTPPPKSSFASPKAPPPNDETKPFHCSQVSYYASQGKSWWGTDAEPFGGKTWYYDYTKQHYVYAKGSQCWISDTDDWNGTWTLQPETAKTVLDGDDGTSVASSPMETATVRDFLASRQPTGFTDTSLDELEQLDGDPLSEQGQPDAAMPEEVQPNAAAQAEQAASHETPQPKALFALESEAPSPAVPLEPPRADPSLPAPAKAAGTVPASEAYRLDKYGKTISPEALYMRFYRKLRSA